LVFWTVLKERGISRLYVMIYIMKILSMFFTDSEVIMVEKKKGLAPLSEYVTAKLPEGYIVNGIIEKYDELVVFVEGVISRTQISAKHVNLLLHEKIVTYKAYVLPDTLKDRQTRKYIETKIESEQGLPFNDPIIDFHISYMKGTKEAIVFGASRALVEKYDNLLTEVGLKLITTDMPALSSHRLYKHLYSDEETQEDYTMFANIYDNIISINFFNRQYPEFNFVSEFEDPIHNADGSDFVQAIQDEIYRMSNYYVWNLNKGKFKIDKAIIVPMTSIDEYNDLIVSTMSDNNLSGVDNLFFFESNENDMVYDVDVKYLLTMSNTF